MNYYKSRQRASDGRWDFSCRNNDHIYPVGYCSPYHEPDPKEWYLTENSIKKYQAERDKHHVNGHATEEEACECYRQYLLDTTLYLDGHSNDTQHKCKICDTWTNRYAQVDGTYMYHLCDCHRTRAIIETLFKGVGEIWSS